LTAAIFSGIIAWLETHQLPCPIKLYLHANCPGCGLQRSFIELMRGNLAGSFQLHAATVPLLFFLIFSTLHVFYRFKKGDSIVIYSSIFIALTVVVNYLFKIIYHS
jgi:hypothetical protein